MRKPGSSEMNSAWNTQAVYQPLVVFGVGVVIAAGTGRYCEAGSNINTPLWSKSISSNSGEYVFIHLSARTLEEQIAEIRACDDDPPYFLVADEETEVRRLHGIYSQSGMYRNKGTSIPIWTPKNESICGKPTDDGKWLLASGYHGWSIEVTGPDGACTELIDYEIAGYVASALYWIAGEYWPEIEDYKYQSRQESLVINFDNGATATIRLDDFAVVQSNVLSNAIATLFTTPRGIAFIMFVLSLCFGVTWAASRCWRGAK